MARCAAPPHFSQSARRLQPGAKIWHFPKEILVRLQGPCNYWTLSIKKRISDYLVIKQQIMSILLKCAKPVWYLWNWCVLAQVWPHVSSASHLSDRKHFGFHECLAKSSLSSSYYLGGGGESRNNTHLCCCSSFEYENIEHIRSGWLNSAVTWCFTIGQ